MLLGIYVLFLLIAAIFQFFQTYFLQKASNQIVKKMRNDIFSHIQKFRFIILSINQQVQLLRG